MAIVLLCGPFDLLITCSSVLGVDKQRAAGQSGFAAPIIPSADIERIYFWTSRTARINNTRTTFQTRRAKIGVRHWTRSTVARSK